jgi:hypothetical protein
MFWLEYNLGWREGINIQLNEWVLMTSSELRWFLELYHSRWADFKTCGFIRVNEIACLEIYTKLVNFDDM